MGKNLLVGLMNTQSGNLVKGDGANGGANGDHSRLRSQPCGVISAISILPSLIGGQFWRITLKALLPCLRWIIIKKDVMPLIPKMSLFSYTLPVPTSFAGEANQ